MRPVNFYIDDRHTWLSPDRSYLPNIGPDGRNLTIVLLSLNRSSLTLRLLRSIGEHIPYFAGKVLIADNGSHPDELEIVEKYCQESCAFQWRILRFGKNFGVAGGRNRAFAEVDTDWIMSLDNDIYFTTNPLSRLQNDISLLGCHFLSVPLLNPGADTFYSFGGHLDTVVHQGSARLTIRCMLPPGAPVEDASLVAPSGDGFLCSFLFGGASLLRRKSFFAVGGFDDAMLVGFEDIDFSLRLFQEGYKVGCSAVAAFVHDHPPAAAPTDQSYEATRFSRQILKDSALHLERKTGFKIWGAEVDSWLLARENGGTPVAPMVSGSVGGDVVKKPRIALVTDIDEWAFANISRQISKHLSDKFDFDIIPMTRLAEVDHARWLDKGGSYAFVEGGGAALGRLALLADQYDLVHVFWREYLHQMNGPEPVASFASYLGLTEEQFRKRFIAPACITTCVYDHLFLGDADMQARGALFNELTADYYVSSEKLDGIYRSYDGVKPPAAVIEDGVDLELFGPRDLDRFATVGEREIVIGWVGNSRWAAGLGDKKGFHTILKPAVEQLRAEGVAVRLETADRQNGFIPHHRMAEYYCKIDLYVCASEIEGTPNPVLESMACGVPVISTDVGIVPQVFGPAQRPFILAERSIDCLKVAIRKLVAEPALFRTLSEENLRQIQAWDWRHQTRKFNDFFDRVLASRMN